MKRFSIPPREERERHSHTMSAYRIIPCLNSLKQRILIIFLPMHNTDNREVSSEEISPDYPHGE